MLQAVFWRRILVAANRQVWRSTPATRCPNPSSGNKWDAKQRWLRPIRVSVLDAKAGYWQARKREWFALGIDSGEGRDDNLLGEGLTALTPGLTGTSIFDPVLAECALSWYASRPQKGASPTIVVDPFAGGSVRGVVASKLGFLYVGTDVSKRQVDATAHRRWKFAPTAIGNRVGHAATCPRGVLPVSRVRQRPAYSAPSSCSGWRSVRHACLWSAPTSCRRRSTATWRS